MRNTITQSSSNSYNDSNNEYFMTLVDPRNHSRVPIPDLNFSEFRFKENTGASRLFGETNYVFLLTPFDVTCYGYLGKIVTNPVTAAQSIGFVKRLTLDSDISTKYSKARLISAITTIVSNTVNGGFEISGLFNGTRFVQSVRVYGIDPTKLSQYNSVDAVINQSAMDGLVCLAVPNGPYDMVSTNAATRGESFGSIHKLLPGIILTAPGAFARFDQTDPVFPDFAVGNIKVDFTAQSTSAGANGGSKFTIVLNYLDDSGNEVSMAVITAVGSFDPATLNYVARASETVNLPFPLFSAVITTTFDSTLQIGRAHV